MWSHIARRKTSRTHAHLAHFSEWISHAHAHVRPQIARVRARTHLRNSYLDLIYQKYRNVYEQLKTYFSIEICQHEELKKYLTDEYEICVDFVSHIVSNYNFAQNLANSYFYNLLSSIYKPQNNVKILKISKILKIGIFLFCFDLWRSGARASTYLSGISQHFCLNASTESAV